MTGEIKASKGISCVYKELKTSRTQLTLFNLITYLLPSEIPTTQIAKLCELPVC